MEPLEPIPQIINLPKFLDRRGNLSFIEQGQHIPFDIARTYWVYDVPGGESRGGHAHKDLYQFPEKLIPLFINNIRHGKPLPVYGKGETVRWYLDNQEWMDNITSGAYENITRICIKTADENSISNFRLIATGSC